MKDQAIVLKDIKKVYRNGSLIVPVLHGVSLTINKGEYVSIMGPSGSGKSTLMNIMGCLDRVSEGEYYLGGNNVANLSDDELAHARNKEIGFVFQSFNLLPKLSALDNVILPMIYADTPKAVRVERAKKLLTDLGLADRMHHLPFELSGGQRQRVAIARALANNPLIIMADEPTGNLDTKSGLEVMDIFKQLHEEGHTIIMVTHEQEIAAYAKRNILLRDGVIIEDKMNDAKEDNHG